MYVVRVPGHPLVNQLFDAYIPDSTNNAHEVQHGMLWRCGSAHEELTMEPGTRACVLIFAVVRHRTRHFSLGLDRLASFGYVGVPSRPLNVSAITVYPASTEHHHPSSLPAA